MSGTSGRNRLTGWTVTLIADGCAAYWLARAGVLGALQAAMAGLAVCVVLLITRGITRSRARRRREELLARLAAGMRQAAQGQRRA